MNNPFDYDEHELEIPEAIERDEWEEMPLSEEELTTYAESAAKTIKLLEKRGKYSSKTNPGGENRASK